LFALFLISFVLVWLETLLSLAIPSKPGWTETFLVLTVTATTLFALSRQLPGQNVFLAAGIIAAISGTAMAVGALSGIPFGPYIFTDAAGPRIFNVLPWSIPVVWIIIILNARGVARLILRPWRKGRLYGYRLIGVTAALTVAFDFAFEPFATHVKDYWLWEPTKMGLLWQGTPPTNFLGWLVTALLILAFVTPALINKSHQKFPPDYHPLAVWLLLSLLFATGEVKHQLWTAAGFVVVAGIATTFMAIRGARW
jgi:putative membrane protein